MARVERRTLRCSRAERAEIRERAAVLGMSVSGYLVACALGESLQGSKLSAIGAIAVLQRAIQSRRGGP